MTLLTDRTTSTLFEEYKFIWKSFVPKGERMDDFNPETDIEHAGKQKSLLNINWLSFSDLEQNCRLMDTEKFENIRSLFCKADHLENHKKHIINSVGYIGNTMLACMADFEYSSIMCRCGTAGETRAYLPCSKWKYCERCANARRRFMFLKYASSFETNDYPYFITLTKNEQVNFIDGNYEQIIRDWDDLNNYATEMIKQLNIVGGLRVEEFSITSLFPTTKVNPHVHILCHSKIELESHVYENIKINVKRVQDDRHWLNCLNYLNKSIDFVDAYAQAWTVKTAETVNRNFRECLGAHKFVINGRNQIRAFGHFHGSSKKCVSAAIKTVTRKKSSLQDTPKKIEYVAPPMYEDFKAGIESRLSAPLKTDSKLLKIAYDELTTPVEERENRPWYKNPWLLGGATLAGAAGLYGAGKYYNDGNNAINNSFGAGVDKYLVNPVKNLFAKPAPPKRPLDGISPIAPQYRMAGIANDYGTNNAVKAQTHLYDRMREINQARAEMGAAATNSISELGLPGSQFSQTPKAELEKGMFALDAFRGIKPELSPASAKELLTPWGSLKPEYTNTANRLNADKVLSNLATKPLTPVQKLTPVMAAGSLPALGLELTKNVTSGMTGKIPQGVAAAAKINPAYMAGADALSGYNAAKSVGANPWLHAANGVLIGARTGLMKPGPAKLPAMLTGAAAYPLIDHLATAGNKGFVDGMKNINTGGVLQSQLQSALNEAVRNKNAIPLRGLLETDLVKKIINSPVEWTDENNLIPRETAGLLAYLQKHGPTSALTAPQKELIARGLKLLPEPRQVPDFVSVMN